MTDPMGRDGETGSGPNGGPGSLARESLALGCSGVIVVAHKEDTARLRETLEQDGFSVEEVRGPYTEEELVFSRNVRCLINHGKAWATAAKRSKPTVIVEADFVPVVGFGRLPMPIPPGPSPAGRFGWLYSAGSILYGIDEYGLPHGHGNTTVAYVVDAPGALALLEFLARETSRPDPGAYRPWETYLGIFLRKERSVRNYFVPKQYGEHGGVANREHGRAGARAWHEADILAGRLAFLPAYARGSTVRYRLRRIRGWFRGFARLLTLRFYDPRYVDADSARGRVAMAWHSVRRLLW